MDNNKEDYNAEPVMYCKRCISLKIKDIPDISNYCYCDDCGSTDIGECNIHEWETMYESRYGHRYIKLKNNV